jgi:hypothetical protein
MELCGAETLSILKRIRLVISGSVSEWISQRAQQGCGFVLLYLVFDDANTGARYCDRWRSIRQGSCAGRNIQSAAGLVGSSRAQAIQLLLANAYNPAAGGIATAVAILFLTLSARPRHLQS